MSRIAYYVLLKPLSLLPLSVLYYLSDFLFWVVYRVVGYRKKVVFTNLRHSFPGKGEAAIEAIAERFYRHFCDLIVESIRLFSMPEAEARARMQVANPELLQRFYDAGRSVLIGAGHYANWELVATIVDRQVAHQCVGIYAPLANAFFNRAIFQSRRRFGLELLPRREVKAWFRDNQDRRTAVLFATDQSPSNPKNAYWTRFLNQETGVLFGIEHYAVKYDLPVVFGHITRLRRGYYTFHFEVVEEHPKEAPYGAITERHIRLLEKDILAEPAYWLWTHRRWKHERPADVEVAGKDETP